MLRTSLGAAIALLALAAGAPAHAQAGVTEKACRYLERQDGISITHEAPDLHVLALSEPGAVFSAELPKGVLVICERSGIVPAAGDWKVVDAGFALALRDGKGRAGALEYGEGGFRYRMIQGKLEAGEAELIGQRIDAFNVAQVEAADAARGSQ